MATKELSTKPELANRIKNDLGDVASLLQAIDEDLLPVKIGNGSFDGIDVAIQLAVRRAGQLVEAVNRSLGHIGFREIEEWLPGPRSSPSDGAQPNRES